MAHICDRPHPFSKWHETPPFGCQPESRTQGENGCGLGRRPNRVRSIVRCKRLDPKVVT
jgi:hypothetical protein